MERATLPDVPPARAAPATVAVAAYAWWATGLPPFELSSTLAVVGAGTVAMVIATRRGGPANRAAMRRSDVVRWSALLGALAAWQLAAYVQHPRREHPTVSSLVDAVLDTHPARAIAFLVWLAAAVRLASR